MIIGIIFIINIFSYSNVRMW